MNETILPAMQIDESASSETYFINTMLTESSTLRILTLFKTKPRKF